MTNAPPDTVFFDAGYTLIEPWPGIGDVYARVAADFGAEAEGAELSIAFRRSWRDARAAAGGGGAPYGRTDAEARAFWYPVVRETFRLAGYRPPQDPGYYPAVYDEFATARCWRVFPDVDAALRLVAEAGARTAVLSNWDARLHPVLEALGLAERFHATVVSCDVGAEKPDPAIYREAARRLGARRPAIIGDEPDADGHGALAAGWAQCLVLRGGRAAPEGLRAAPTLDGAVRVLLGSGAP
ncbi:MAG: HAD-IA family hydrolase [Candidatus Sumerlaeia bacterium]|nr:HAD-IA family hydrolase [Candidatus Sumerlaeia bacterium]